MIAGINYKFITNTFHRHNHMALSYLISSMPSKNNAINTSFAKKINIAYLSNESSTSAKSFDNIPDSSYLSQDELNLRVLNVLQSIPSTPNNVTLNQYFIPGILYKVSSKILRYTAHYYY